MAVSLRSVKWPATGVRPFYHFLLASPDLVPPAALNACPLLRFAPRITTQPFAAVELG